MLLAIDVGNTNVVIALFHETELVHEWRINSDPKRTADEYISILLSLFRDAGLSLSAIDSSVMSTVVPQLLGPFIRVVERLSGKKPLVVNASMKTIQFQGRNRFGIHQRHRLSPAKHEFFRVGERLVLLYLEGNLRRTDAIGYRAIRILFRFDI